MGTDAALREIVPLAFTEYSELKSLAHQLEDLRSANEYPYPLIVCRESRMIPAEEHQFRLLIMTAESLRHSQEHEKTRLRRVAIWDHTLLAMIHACQ